jgi:hypothetical protein
LWAAEIAEAALVDIDAAGVRATGPEATFQAERRSLLASDVIRQGTKAKLHLVYEGIAAHKPRSLDSAEATELPLTTMMITAWERMFDRLDVRRLVNAADPRRSHALIESDVRVVRSCWKVSIETICVGAASLRIGGAL